MIITGLAVPTPSATLSPVPVYVVPQGGGGANAVEVWTLIVAAAAVVASIVAAVLLRRTGKGTVAAAGRSATASKESAAAADRAATAATTAAAQLDTWRQREESMRMLRWAADNAVSEDVAKSIAGQAALEALEGHNLVQPLDKDFIHAVRMAIVQDVLAGLGDEDSVYVDDEYGP